VREQGDKFAERRELVGAGWEPREVEGTVVWKNPANGYFYPHSLALQLSREQSGGRARGGPSDETS
jgi:hypothetical protein